MKFSVKVYFKWIGHFNCKIYRQTIQSVQGYNIDKYKFDKNYKPLYSKLSLLIKNHTDNLVLSIYLL